MVMMLSSLAAACAAPVDGAETEPRVADCPATQVSVIGRDGRPHCVIPNDLVNTFPGCHPVACQVLEDWAITGDGGEGALNCAAACEAFCADAFEFEREARRKAEELGFRCEY